MEGKIQQLVEGDLHFSILGGRGIKLREWAEVFGAHYIIFVFRIVIDCWYFGSF